MAENDQGMFGKLGSGASNLVGGGSIGKIALYGCGAIALLIGGLIFIISFAFMSRGEPADLGLGVYDSGNDKFYAKDVDSHEIENYLKMRISEISDEETEGDYQNPFLRPGVGQYLLNSGKGEEIITRQCGDDPECTNEIKDKYRAGANVPLIMAIAYAETGYATALSEDDIAKYYNAFGSTEGSKNRDPLIEYPDWKTGIEAQGQYLVDNYFTSDVEREQAEDLVHFVGRVREESSEWANIVVAEKTRIEQEIPELSNVGALGPLAGACGAVPIYKQCDAQWGNTIYGESGHECTTTICSSGCGVSAMAMFLSYYLDTEITPLEMANDAMEHGGRKDCSGGTQKAWFKDVASRYGLSEGFSELGNTNWGTIVNQLRKDRPVIVSGSGLDPFTSGGHFIVLTCLDEAANKIGINDPARLSIKEIRWFPISNKEGTGIKDSFHFKFLIK